uniref:Uncharacterized protein n=1 Tax=Tetranychus urticae TaxID=32264 RepID=T1JR50_TETUR
MKKVDAKSLPSTDSIVVTVL